MIATIIYSIIILKVQTKPIDVTFHEPLVNYAKEKLGIGNSEAVQPKVYRFTTAKEIHPVNNDEFCILNVTLPDGSQYVVFQDVDVLPTVNVVPKPSTESYVVNLLQEPNCDTRAQMIWETMASYNLVRDITTYFQVSYVISNYQCAVWSDEFVKGTQARLFAKLGEIFGLKLVHHATHLINVNSPCAKKIDHYKLHMRTYPWRYLITLIVLIFSLWIVTKPLSIIRLINRNPDTWWKKTWNWLFGNLIVSPSEIAFLLFSTPWVFEFKQLFETWIRFLTINTQFDEEKMKRTCLHMDIKTLTKNHHLYTFPTTLNIPSRQIDNAIDLICYYVDYLNDLEHAEFITKYKVYIETLTGNARKQSINRLEESLRKRKNSIVDVTPNQSSTRKNAQPSFEDSTFLSTPSKDNL